MVLERYAGVQTVAFCGVFPEIGRAWASVDNSLFMWRYDRWWAATVAFLVALLREVYQPRTHAGRFALSKLPVEG